MGTRRDVLKAGALGLVSSGILSGQGTADTTASSNSWPQYQYDTHNSGINHDGAGPKRGVTKTLTTKLENRYRPIVPVADQSHCYVQGDGVTYAIDRASGSISWKAYEIRIAWGGLAYAEGMVLGAGNTLVALDAESGEPEWNYQLSQGDPAGHTPTIHDGVAYVGGYGGTFHAIDIADGTAVWTENIGASITVSPVVSEGTVYFADDKGEMHARDIENGETKWTEHVAQYGLEGSPTLADGTLYVGGGSNDAVYAVGTETGDRKWAADTNASIETSPIVFDGSVFAVDIHGKLYAIDASTGDVQWNKDTVSSDDRDAVVADGLLYLTGPSAIEALSLPDGERQFRAKKPYSASTPIVVDDMIYLVNQNESVNELRGYAEPKPATSTATPTESEQSTPTEPTAGSTTETSGPGFGVISAAAGVVTVGVGAIAKRIGPTDN